MLTDVKRAFSSALAMIKRGVVGAFWTTVTLFSLFVVVVAIQAILPGATPIVICGLATVVLITIVFLAKFIVEWITITAHKSYNNQHDSLPDLDQINKANENFTA